MSRWAVSYTHLLGEHFLKQHGADIFETADGLVDRSLVVEAESALDVAQLVGHFPSIDFNILNALLGLQGGVAGFLTVAHDFVDIGTGLVNFAVPVKVIRCTQVRCAIWTAS